MTRGDMKDSTHTLLLWLYGIILSVYAELQPIHSIIWTMVMLIIADTFLGLWASIKTKMPLTSARGGRLFSKMAVYVVVLAALFEAQKNIFGEEWISAVKLAAGAMAVVECVSILENAGTIIGQPVFKFLIDKLSSKNNKE